jgi:hypothetical protein
MSSMTTSTPSVDVRLVSSAQRPISSSRGGGRAAVLDVRVRVRRLVCPTRGCRQTFREQIPGVFERYQRRTARPTRQVKAVVKELAGRAGSRSPAILAAGLSRHTALRALLRIPLPTGRTPRVIGVGSCAVTAPSRPWRARRNARRGRGCWGRRPPGRPRRRPSRRAESHRAGRVPRRGGRSRRGRCGVPPGGCAVPRVGGWRWSSGVARADDHRVEVRRRGHCSAASRAICSN